ncbi:MAG TPA: hypothetical protein VG759_12025 [Candidatus Angelobacter sp.]|jgi:hypothetical protein|nr:hypothetical protein [Candidatus Angelobacter sp.]
MPRRKKEEPASGDQTVSGMRNSALQFLMGQYRDALQYTNELKRAIASFSGELPPDSPYRYAAMTVGEAILKFLDHAGKPHTIRQLISELESGGCTFGLIKSRDEIVRKAVMAFVRQNKLMWLDKEKTLVARPNWGFKKQVP